MNGVPRLALVHRIAAGVLLAGGMLVLAGWMFDIGVLKSVLPGRVSMKATTSVCFVLLGGSLLLLPGGRVARLAGTALAVAVVLLAGATLAQYVSNVDLGIDEMIVEDTDSSLTSAPGRMSPFSAVSLVALAVGLLTRERLGVARALAMLVFAILVTASIGYVLDATPLLGATSATTAIALNTVLLLACALAGYVALLFPETVIDIFRGRSAAASLTRRMLPSAVLVPVLAAIGVGALDRRGFIGPGTGLAVLTGVSSIVFLALVAITRAAVATAEEEKMAVLVEARDRLEALVASRTAELAGANARLEDALQDAARLAAIVSSTHDAVMAVGRDGIIRTWNQGASRLFGYEAEEAIGKHVSMLIPERLVDESSEMVTRARRGELVVGHVTQRAHKDGRLIDVALTVSPVYGPGGEVDSVSSISRDVTHELQVLEDLRRSNADLERFASVAAHDLRAPLASLQLTLELLEKRAKGALDADSQALLAGALEAVPRMRGLIESLLTYARVGSELKVSEDVDLNAVVAEVIADTSAQAQRADATIVAGPLPHVRGDPVLLRQALTNLVSNALAHAGRAPLHVAITATDRPLDVVVAVADDGMGFDPKERERIFGLFERLDARGGAGMGLAIVRRIAHLHGGRAWAQSTPGEGATFYLSIDHEPPVAA